MSPSHSGDTADAGTRNNGNEFRLTTPHHVRMVTQPTISSRWAQGSAPERTASYTSSSFGVAIQPGRCVAQHLRGACETSVSLRDSARKNDVAGRIFGDPVSVWNSGDVTAHESVSSLRPPEEIEKCADRFFRFRDNGDWTGPDLAPQVTDSARSAVSVTRGAEAGQRSGGSWPRAAFVNCVSAAVTHGSPDGASGPRYAAVPRSPMWTSPRRSPAPFLDAPTGLCVARSNR